MPAFRCLPLAAVLVAAAGATHIAAGVPHFADDPAFGVSFIVFGWTQLLLAAGLLVRPGRPVVSGALLVNVAALAVWGLSRTAGLPLGHPGPEPIALADTIAVVLEGAAVGLLAARWSGSRAMLGRSVGAAAALSVVALAATGGTTAAVASLASLASGHGHGVEGAASGRGHGDDAGASDLHSGQSQFTDAGRVGDTPDGGAVHQHDDGSWHVHEPGRAHEHADGTVHVHLGGDGTVAPAPAPAERSSSQSHNYDDGDDHHDGHDHTH